MTRHIIALFALGTMLLAGAASADSLERQHNAEIAYCTDETNQRASRTTPALDRVQECLRTNGWLPGSGNPRVLPRDFVDRINRAFGKDAR
jgi:hypothetical protein